MTLEVKVVTRRLARPIEDDIIVAVRGMCLHRRHQSG